MKSRCPVSLFIVGLLMFGTATIAWSQDCCKRVYRPPCKVACGYDSCRPCCPNPLIEVLKEIDCALQSLLPCRRSCGKTACDAKPTYKAKPTCGCGVPLAPVPSEPSPDPFMDDDLQPPPIPISEAKHVPNDSRATRRATHSPAARAGSIIPQRFKPTEALPLPKTVSLQKPVIDKDATGSTASETKGKNAVVKGKRPLLKSVRLAEFVLP